MKPVKIIYSSKDVIFIIHNECIYHVKNMGGKYWDKKLKKNMVTVTFSEK